MRWPWESKHHMKATDRESTREVLEPAIEEVNKAQVHLQRINRILVEAKKAEDLVIKTQRR